MQAEKIILPTLNEDRDVDSGISRPLEQRVPNRIIEVTSLVEKLVASWHTSSQILQLRRWHRVPYQRPILLTPLDDRTNEPIEAAALMVAGRDISLGGISFLHPQPLPYRMVICTFEPNKRGSESVVVRLTWCRFTRDGCYQSGGKFLKTIDFEIDPAIDWSQPPAA